MPMITLTKAARLQGILRRKLATMRLSAETTMSIFIADPAGETGADTLDASLLDETAAASLRKRVAGAQRRLEAIGDQLRDLNGSARIGIADEMLDWLYGENVI
jgi:hypothetical protein